jgi:hypothetical protein
MWGTATEELKMQTFNVGLFTFEGGVYASEASDLGLPPGEVPREIGVTHRSGVVTRFVFSHDGYDEDGDIVSFNYRSTTGPEYLSLYND